MGQINDDKYAWLLSKGINPLHIDDMEYKYLNPFFATDYDFALYGDSQVDPAATSTVDPIGWDMHLFTSRVVTYNDQATGGWRLDQIRIQYDTTAPIAGTNADLIQGGINDIVQDRLLSLMIADTLHIMNTSLLAGRFVLLIGMTPMGTAHASYTIARNQKILDYNTWGRTTFPNQFVETYDDIGDSVTPGDIALAYQKNSTDLHISDNGCRRIGQNIGSKLFTLSNVDLTPKVNNINDAPRDMTAWNVVNCNVGGPLVKLADGSFSALKGLLPDDTVSSTKVITNSYTATIPDATPIVVTVHLRPGQFRWVRLQYSDNAGTQHVRYVDIIGFIQGTGTANWVPSKAAHGWVKVELAIDSGTGAAVNNNTDVRPVTGDGLIATVGINTSQPMMYIDLSEAYAA